jgi:hypothetical protein
MKTFIRRRIREQMIDGQDMSQATQTICNKMTINSYDEAISLVQQSLKQFDDRTKREIMQKIHVPLENLKQEQINISREKKYDGMSGDSMADEADTYWHQIQSTICELGPDFE